jgi:hypothetical protein
MSATSEDVRRLAIARIKGVNRRLPRQDGGAEARATSAFAAVPVAKSIPLASDNPGFVGFRGVTAFDSESVGIAAEPPDQGLCVGNDTVFVMVNVAIIGYDTSGQKLSDPTDLNTFFSAPSSDFLTDPRCYFDSTSNTFFFSITDLGGFPGTLSGSSLLLGVMPADGSTVTTYQLDTVDDGTGGTPSHPHCPCFEDQPLLGADANGIYISGNEFPLDPESPFANGAQIYAINKADLVNLTATPGTVVFSAPIRIGRIVAFSVQPAASPAGQFESAHGGTEFFLSSLDPNGTRDSRVALWALTNTRAIPSSISGTPVRATNPTLRFRVLVGRLYGPPPAAVQEAKAGFTPLAGGNLETLATDDDRMQQAIFAGGKIYSALTTILRVNRAIHSGILYFVVRPVLLANGAVSGRILTRSYIASTGLDLFYPSVAVTTNGSAAMTFSLSGAGNFPSAGYLPLTTDVGDFLIHVAAIGAGPYDGLSGATGDGSPARWGDYSAAVADGDNLWMASEYVSGSCDDARYALDPTCGGIRASSSNWGTFAGRLTR